MDMERPDNLFAELDDEQINQYIQDNLNEEEYSQYVKAGSVMSDFDSIERYIGHMQKAVKKLKDDMKNGYGVNARELGILMDKNRILWQKASDLSGYVTEDAKSGIGEGGSILMKAEDIEIESIQEKIWHIKLPVLLPDKKLSMYIPKYEAAYRMPVQKALSDKFPGSRPRYYEKASIVIIHNFEEGQKVRDHDNFDYSILINCLATFFLTDDGPAFYDLHIAGRTGERSFTEIYLTPEANFKKIWGKLRN